MCCGTLWLFTERLCSDYFTLTGTALVSLAITGSGPFPIAARKLKYDFASKAVYLASLTFRNMQKPFVVENGWLGTGQGRIRPFTRVFHSKTYTPPLHLQWRRGYSTITPRGPPDNTDEVRRHSIEGPPALTKIPKLYSHRMPMQEDQVHSRAHHGM